MEKIVSARNVLRVALYVRVSTQEQADEGYSVGEQTDRLKKYAEAMGWQVYKIYVDPGYSGGNTDRPGLKEMIKDIEKGNIDTVVVYKLDRLSRSQFDTLYLIEKVFLTNNTDFVSMTENFNTGTPLGRAMIGFLAVFAQLEKDKINERMVMGKEARAKSGKWGGGAYVPPGYDYHTETDELTVNEYEKIQILEIVDLFLKGVPIKTICTIMDEKGYAIKGRNGKSSKWDPKKIRHALRNKTYIGYISYNDEWYKGSHTPILTDEKFEQITQLMNQREEMYKDFKYGNRKHTTYLGGFLYCKCCGGRFSKQLNSRRREGKNKVYWYMCYSKHKRVKAMIKDPNCKNKNWKMNELDNLVFDEIRKLALDPNYIHDIRAEKNNNSDTPDKITILKKQIEDIDSQISRFMDLYGIGKFTIDQVSNKVDPLNEQKQGLEKELESLNADMSEMTDEEVYEIVSTFGDVLERGDIGEIRILLEALISYIEVDNEDIYIHWKFA